MLFIGAVFLSFSGLIYFVFMAAWLNAFRWLGEIAMVTTVAGMLAIIIALINIKDYFWFKKGISLSLSDAAQPRLYPVSYTHLDVYKRQSLLCSRIAFRS